MCSGDLAQPEQTEEENGRFKTVFALPKYCPHCGAKNVLTLSSSRLRDRGKSDADLDEDSKRSESDDSSENDYFITCDLQQRTVPDSGNRASLRFQNDSLETYNLTVYRTPASERLLRRRSSSQQKVKRRKKRSRAESASVFSPFGSNARKKIGGESRRNRSWSGADGTEVDTVSNS